MFTPSQADVRRFFCSVYAKSLAGQPLEAIETIASQWLEEHPEYHGDFADAVSALEKMYDVEAGKTNPFLHLSMHLSISEQCSIDQPQGIRQAVELLTARRNSTPRPPRSHGLSGPDGLGEPARRQAARWGRLHRVRAAPSHQRLAPTVAHNAQAPCPPRGPLRLRAGKAGPAAPA